MKKTLTVVIALLLVVCFVFSLAACNKNNGDSNGGKVEPVNPTPTPTPGGNDDPTPGPGGDDTKTIAADVVSATDAAFVSYSEAYLLNNASDGVSANALQKQLDSIRKVDAYKDVIKSISVKASGDDYAVTITYKDNQKSELTVAGAAEDAGFKAGATFTKGENDGSLSANRAIGIIFNAAMATIEKAIAEGTAFTDNGFGVSAETYFQFNYGDLTSELLNYALSVKANIGIEAKDTAVSIEVKQNDEVLGGLYYKGAEAQEDCDIYLALGEDVYYIDYADVNAIVMSIIEMAQQKIVDEGYDVPELPLAEDDDEVVEEAPFYSMRIEQLTDLFAGLGGEDSSLDIGSLVGDILDDVLGESVGYVTETDGTVYQINIDLDALLNYISGMKSILGNISLDSLPAPLNTLDLGSFQGVGGALLITAKVYNDGDEEVNNTLGAVELSYNVGKKDFRFNATDDVAKVYGPVNVALGVTGFSLGEQQDVVPAFPDAQYFSPLNAAVSASVEINGDAYVINAASAVNPFHVVNGVITFDATNADNEKVLDGSITIDEKEEGGLDAFIRVIAGDEYYESYGSEVDFGTPIVGAVAYIFMAPDSILQPLVAYVSDLIAMFQPEEEVEEEIVEDEEPSPEGEIEEESSFDVMGLVGAFDELKTLFTETWNGTVFTYGTDPIFFEGKVAAAQYNQVLDIVMPKLAGLVPDDALAFRFDETAAEVYANYNKGEYANKAIVKVTYEGKDYIALLDLTEYDLETGLGSFVATFSMNDSVYAINFSNANWDEDGVATITYSVKTGDEDAITYVDFTLNANESSIVLKLLANGNPYKYEFGMEQAEDGNVIITACLDEKNVLKVYGGNGFFNKLDKTTSFGIPTFEVGCTFGWDIPSSKVNVNVKSLKLVSWGENLLINTVQFEDGVQPQTIDALLNKCAEAFYGAFMIPAEEPVEE
jgi:hypothetical protein